MRSPGQERSSRDVDHVSVVWRRPGAAMRRAGPLGAAERDRRRSDGADGERLGAPGPLANLELHRLADRQRLRTVIQHVRSVDEHITAIRLGDEPEAALSR